MTDLCRLSYKFETINMVYPMNMSSNAAASKRVDSVTDNH